MSIIGILRGSTATMSKLGRYLLREYVREILRLIVAALFHYSGFLWLKKKLSKCPGIRVLVYHRINEISVDSMTIHPRKFERQISYIKNRFQVLKISELIDLIESQEEIPIDAVAITFDDGYLDNFTAAAPALEKYGISACFFVASDLIGTGRVFEHDKREGVRFPTMTWENLSEILARGHDIGSHTANHVDLGACAGERAEYEVFGSKRKIEENLGTKIDLLALPFGYKEHASPSAIALVKQAGYRCCCYGYGGVNTVTTDRYHIRRQCITPSWSFFVFKRALDGAFDFKIFDK